MELQKEVGLWALRDKVWDGGNLHWRVRKASLRSLHLNQGPRDALVRCRAGRRAFLSEGTAIVSGEELGVLED